jgi:hypothetical protein
VNKKVRSNSKIHQKNWICMLILKI